MDVGTIGSLGLKDDEEIAVGDFMETLTGRR